VTVKPPLLDLMVKNLREVNGEVITVREDEILEAFTGLARKGFFIEPSSAVAYAAFRKQLAGNEAAKYGKKLIILTGTGLKTTLAPIGFS
jgi:threonine synthase